MDGTWSVYFEDRSVGTCRIGREGLYYRFSCRCNRVRDGICRLLLKCGDRTVDLGILIPVDGGYGLDKKLPMRHMPEGEPRFIVKLQLEQADRRFVPVQEGEKCAFLTGLTDARFGKQDGEVGVFLP